MPNWNQKYSSLDYQSIKASIKEHGLHVPIILNQHGVILDGHHRYKACHELGFKPKTTKMKFEDLKNYINNIES
jgi:ParB-like chromosome segregation protein Spo0J